MTDDIDRRDVLRGLGGLALAGALGCGRRGAGDPGEPTADVDQSVVGIGTCSAVNIAAVANRPIAINTVEAYAQKSVAAGETIDFRVSSPVPYLLSVVRLGWDADSPSRDWTLHRFPQFPASPQSIRPGSYVHVESALDPTATFTQLTLECWVRPFRETTGGYWQGLMSQHTNTVGGAGQCGFGLFLTDANVPCFYFGNGGAFNQAWFRSASAPLDKLTWHHVVAVFNAGTARLYVDGAPVTGTVSGFPTAVTPGSAPLRLGAYGDATGTSFFLDGDLAMPVIYRRALNGSEIAARAGATPPQVPVDSAVIGCWPLNEEQGVVVADASGCGRTGTIVNRGTWMIGGPGFNAAAVDRFATYNPDSDATRGHGLRLSSKDFYDCAWPISQSGSLKLSYTLPSDCLPGVYVGRIIYNTTDPCDVYDRDKRYDVTFVVRRAANRPCAPVLVLCSTTTWHAYNYPFGLFGFYYNHAWTSPAEDLGQPTYYQGTEMPWNIADPYLTVEPDPRVGDPIYEDPHDGPWVRAERFLHVWLEMNGYDYDVISDHDLHLNPSILSSYQTVFIAGHSEYWSREGWSAVRSYLAAGGHMIVASGNTMFWRVTYNDSVIECRKKGQGDGGERPHAEYGELYHEHDHQRGGLMREAGSPGWQAIALETRGYGSGFHPYTVTNPGHEFFTSPEVIDVQPNPVTGVCQTLGGEFAIGHEWDSAVGRIPGAPLPLPSDYTPVVLATGYGDIDGWNITPLNYKCEHECGPEDPVPCSADVVISEITDWQWASGGHVFSVGSINAAKSLHMDEKMAALFRNVLHHNGVVFQLNLMAIGQDGRFNHKTFGGSTWSTGWSDHGTGFSNPPTGVQWGPNSIAAMAIAADGHFYYKFNAGAGWSPWNDFGGVFQGRPAAVGWGRNRLDLFARGGDHLWHGYWNGSAWNDEGPTWVGRWIDLGSGVASDPAAISSDGNRPSVAVLGTAGNIDYRYNLEGTWVRQDLGTPTGHSFVYAPTMVTFGGSRLAVFGVDNNGRAWVKHWDGGSCNPSFTAWTDLGLGLLAGRVHVASWGLNGYSVFGVDVNGHLKWKWWDGTAWGPSQTGWSDLGGSLVGEPTVVVYRGLHVGVFGVAPSGSVQHLLWNGFAWSGWQDFGGNMRQSPAVFRSVAT
jgi:hypothetical protein